MKKEDLRIVYMGTPDFAVEALRQLVEGGYNVVGVITMPDKPAGRGIRRAAGGAGGGGVVHGTGGGHSVPEGPGALWQAGGHPGQREAGRRPFDPVCPDPAHPGRADSQRRGRGSELHL